MADNNLSAQAAEPVDDADSYEPSFDDRVEDISNLLSDPDDDPDLQDGDEEPVAEDEPDDPEESEEGEPEEDEAEPDEDADESQDLKGGRFAPDTAKVTMEDGTVTTVAELKRGTLFHADYTRKTQELAVDRDAVKAEREKVNTRASELDQYAQNLSQSRDYLAWYAEQFLPMQPEPFRGNPAEDPLGYLQWQQQRDAYVAHAQAYQRFKAEQDQEKSRKSKEDGEKSEAQKQAEAKQVADRMAQEREALKAAVPALKDPAKAKALVDGWVNGAGRHYGFTAQEVNSIGDHRMMLVLRDALAYRKLQAKGKTVQKEVTTKPVLKPGKRVTTPQGEQQRRANSEQLRKTGSLDAAARALANLDL